MTEQHFPKIQQMAEKLRFLRVHEGLTIKDLAHEMSMQNGRLLDLEAGAKKVDIQDMIRYCDFFGLGYENFLLSTLVEFKSGFLADEKKRLGAAGHNV